MVLEYNTPHCVCALHLECFHDLDVVLELIFVRDTQIECVGEVRIL
jgi:hypothetical protein